VPRRREIDDMAPEKGTLFIVATPIGNPEDISPRALSVLKSVDLIAAEDTRVAGRFLKGHGIDTPLVSFFEHNEIRKMEGLLEHLGAGASIAVISDAGTPLISDPGYRLVRAAQERGIKVVPVPGPSAVMAALSVAGLPTDRFLFAGFPPRKAGKLERELRELSELPYTLVFFESPHRLMKTLEAMRDPFGGRTVVLCRELTKPYEEILRGTPGALISALAGRKIRGEVTLIVEGKGKQKPGKKKPGP